MSLPSHPRCRGRRAPVQGVLLLVTLLPRSRPDDEDREQLLCGDGATHLMGPNPVSHPPHEPPFDLQRKASGVSLQSPIVQASRARHGLLVLSQNRWGARRLRQSHKTDARARHCRRQLRLPLGDGRRGGRLECALLPGRGRLPHPGTRRHSQMRLSVLFVELLHVAASFTERRLRRAFAAAALAAIVDAAQAVPGDNGIRHST